jgi:hypothetical protein
MKLLNLAHAENARAKSALSQVRVADFLHHHDNCTLVLKYKRES